MGCLECELQCLAMRFLLLGAFWLLTNQQPSAQPSAIPKSAPASALASKSINFFSLAQDIEIGTEASAEAERMLPLVKDANLNRYIRLIGQRLSANAPLPKLQYRFRIVNSKDVDSVGFPGGAIYINRGLLELAANEDEFAAILAHEIGHVAARHGTAQLSRQLLVKAPISIAGGLPTQDGWKEQLTKLGVSFGPTFLRYTRDQEIEASIVAVRLLSESHFDANGLRTILSRLSFAPPNEVSRPLFIFNHPQGESISPELDAEITAVTTKPRTRSGQEFRAFQSALVKLPFPAEKESRLEGPASGIAEIFKHPLEYYILGYPSGWQVTRNGPNGAIIAPADGVQSSRVGDDVTRGAMFDLFDVSDRPLTLEQATNRLIIFLRQRNQSLRVVPGAQTHTLVSDEPGLRTIMIGKSNTTDSVEVVWVVTRMYYQSLFYIVFVAPEEEFPIYQPTFEQMIRSVHLR